MKPRYRMTIMPDGLDIWSAYNWPKQHWNRLIWQSIDFVNDGQRIAFGLNISEKMERQTLYFK